MKGILFTESMFNAVIEGRKTQTRRIMNLTHIISRYKVGDVVYLKEPYALNIQSSKNVAANKFEYKSKVLYKYVGDTIPEPLFKWQNKRFMPAKYARYFIEITGVRCEKLQDISDEDYLKEGILKTKNYSSDREWGWEEGQRDYYTPKQAYAALIDKINGKGTWESNAWVWVYDFKLINKTFDEILEENKDILKRLKDK